jgi:hypothetical protein
MITCTDSCLCVYHVVATLLALRTNRRDTNCPEDAVAKTSLAVVATAVVDVVAVADAVAADVVAVTFPLQSLADWKEGINFNPIQQFYLIFQLSI